MAAEIRVLGIDPGSVVCGYGVVEKLGNEIKLIECGVIYPKRKNESFPLRLKVIYEQLTSVIDRSMPDESAFESMFYSKNAQTLIKLSQARASAMLATTMREVPIAEYSPREIKKSVTGNGASSKEQVQFMVKKILGIKDNPEFLDISDALAAAICHCFKRTSIQGKSGSWSDFVKNNPERVRGL